MSSKPKKTLSDEQLKKMQEGRKKASDKRKIEREEAKSKAKEMDIAKKSKDKQKLLDLELQALAQQQSRIDNLKIQVDRKKEVKSKLKAIKEEDEKEPQQIYEEPIIEEQAKAEHTQGKQPKEEEPAKAEHKQPAIGKEPPTDAEYAEVFNSEARKIREKLPQESKKYFDNATNKFDFTLSLDDNIKGMIDYVKTIVEKNTEIAKSIRDSKRELEDKKEIVQPTHAERVAEHAVNSKIQKLMRMRY